MTKPRLSNMQILNISMGLLGINFGWGLQMANMSAIYEYLGAQPDKIPILWLAAPLTGLLVQPIIGHMSDNTWGKAGRRKPYFLFGAILSTLAIIFMPLCTALWMAALLLWVLDASVNISMGPFRALVPDMLPEEQYTKGYVFQAILIALGTVLASAMPWILQHVFGINGSSTTQTAIPMLVRYSFWTGAVVFFVTILWTVVTTKEYPPEMIATEDQTAAEKQNVKGMIATILHDMCHMPEKMKTLAWVMIFSWMALFCMFLFFPIAVANRVFHAAPGTPEYLQGIEWGGVCFAAYGFFFMIFSFILGYVAKKISRRTIHFISLLCGGLGLVGILFVQTKFNLLWLMLGVGIAFASMQSMPYAMLADSIPPKKMGIYMGIFNLFIVIPEILVSLGFGYIMEHFLHDSRTLGVVCGGVSMIIAAFLTLRVKDHSKA